MPRSIKIVTGLQGDCKPIRDSITYVQPNDLSELKYSISSLEGAIRSLESTIERRVERVSERVSSVERTVRRLEERIGQVETGLSALSSIVDLMGQRVGTLEAGQTMISQALDQAAENITGISEDLEQTATLTEKAAGTLGQTAKAIDEHTKVWRAWSSQASHSLDELGKRGFEIAAAMQTGTERVVESISTASTTGKTVLDELSAEVGKQTEAVTSGLSVVNNGLADAGKQASEHFQAKMASQNDLIGVSRDSNACLQTTRASINEIHEAALALSADQTHESQILGQQRRNENAAALVQMAASGGQDASATSPDDRVVVFLAAIRALAIASEDKGSELREFLSEGEPDPNGSEGTLLTSDGLAEEVAQCMLALVNGADTDTRMPLGTEGERGLIFDAIGALLDMKEGKIMDGLTTLEDLSRNGLRHPVVRGLVSSMDLLAGGKENT